MAGAGGVGVRAAGVGDVPAILPMVRAVCAYHEGLDPGRYDYLPDVVERYARWLPSRAADPGSVLLVAERAAAAGGEREGGLVGFLVGSVEGNIPVYRTRRYGFVHDLWVEPPARRLGAGRALVTEALARFRAMGVTQVRLETAAGNEGARRLFGACGMRVGGVEMMVEFGGGEG
jgi:ribosomal protein S18 acetylase RimI-like enzyme